MDFAARSSRTLVAVRGAEGEGVWGRVKVGAWIAESAPESMSFEGSFSLYVMSGGSTAPSDAASTVASGWGRPILSLEGA